MPLGRVLIAVEFCWPLTPHKLRVALAEEGLAPLLASAGAELTLAFPLAPPAGQGSGGRDRAQILDLVGELRAGGIGAGLWPVLQRQEWEPLLGADYYFLCAPTARIFERSLAQAQGLFCGSISHLLFDLEPPQFLLLKPLRLFLPGWRTSFRAAADSLRRIGGMLAEFNVASVACFFPPLIADSRYGLGRALERVAAVPAFAASWDYYAPLYYSSLAERYLMLPRPWARRLTARGVGRAVARWGDRALPMLGTLGPGLMGEPQHLEAPADLEFEIRMAARAGARHVGIYNLEGILYHYRRGRLVGKRERGEIESFFGLLSEVLPASLAAAR